MGRRLMASNGEVEGPDDHAGQATRAHTVFPRPRRQTDHASRTPPTIVRRRHPTVNQEAQRHEGSAKQRRRQVDQVSDAMRLAPTKSREERERLKDMGQRHNTEPANARGQQCSAEIAARDEKCRGDGEKDARACKCQEPL
jgi:hypothetical protein